MQSATTVSLSRFLFATSHSIGMLFLLPPSRYVLAFNISASEQRYQIFLSACLKPCFAGAKIRVHPTLHRRVKRLWLLEKRGVGAACPLFSPDVRPGKRENRTMLNNDTLRASLVRTSREAFLAQTNRNRLRGMLSIYWAKKIATRRRRREERERNIGTFGSWLRTLSDQLKLAVHM